MVVLVNLVYLVIWGRRAIPVKQDIQYSLVRKLQERKLSVNHLSR